LYRLLVLIFTILALTPSVIARDGDLDKAYGSGGVQTTNLQGLGGRAHAVAIQPDRKLIIGGVGHTSGFFGGNDFALVRYNLDGTLDTSFGTGGKVLTDFFHYQDEIHDLAIQFDGKIVAVGRARRAEDAAIFFALARYNPDGSLDSTFGSGGKVTTDVNGYALAVVIRPDGKIVVAGRSDSSSGTDVNFALARYNVNGSLDETFGSGGLVLTDFGGFDVANDLILQPDAKLIAVGVKNGDASRNNYALARYTSDGNLDPSFGSGGKVETDFSNEDDRAQSVALASDGKIVVAGPTGTPVFNPVSSLVAGPFLTSTDPNPNFGLARYNSNGSLDQTFGNSGKVNTIFQSPFAENETVVIQPDGKIVSAGWCEQGFALARYLPDGKLDPTFGAAGTVITFASRPLFAATLQPDGKLLGAGGSGANGFVTVRYLMAPPDAPILLTETTTTQAVAVNSVTFVRGPFAVTDGFNVSTDHRTRVIIFAANLELSQGENSSSVFVEARTSGGSIVQLPIEHFGVAPHCDWFKQITVRLPDQLAGAGLVHVRITHGNRSNEGSIVIN
jgi:uncharacterized delta-60 repeat protein